MRLRRRETSAQYIADTALKGKFKFVSGNLLCSIDYFCSVQSQTSRLFQENITDADICQKCPSLAKIRAKTLQLRRTYFSRQVRVLC